MKKRLLPLFLSQSLLSVAGSLLGFFSAIFIYKKTSSILTVAWFFLVLYLFKTLATFWAENLAQKFGLKSQAFIGHFFTILTLLAFFASEKNFAFIWLAAAFWGLSSGFFWFGRHGLFLKIGKQGQFGQSVGWSGIINTFLLLGVPFLGGVLISRFGYSILFLVALIFVVLAVLVLVPLQGEKTHRDVKLIEIFKLFLTHKRMTLAYFSSGAIGGLYSALILYIFLVLKKELTLGGFFSLSMLLVALANFATGSRVDKKGKKNLMTYGAIFTSLVWLGRFIVSTIGGLFVLNVIEGVAGGMLGIPLEVLSYEKAIDGQSTGRALLFRETAINFGAIFGCLLFAGLAVLNLQLKFAFLAAMIFSLLPLLVIKNIELMDGHDQGRF